MGEEAEYLIDMMMFNQPEFSEDEQPVEIECKRCGAKGLHWVETDEGWQLFTAKYLKHVCSRQSKLMQRAVANKFDIEED